MGKPEDVPDDVWEAARKALIDAHRNPEHEETTLPLIARAILAERERCAKIAEGDSNTFDFPKAWSEMRDSDAAHASARLNIAAAIRKGGE